MALDVSMKVGPELRLYISSAGQTLLSVTPEGTAFENIGGTISWEEIEFVRPPVDRSEPKEIVDIYKRFSIDHTKRGREQRKTGSFTVGFQNTSLSIRKYKDLQCLLRLSWHVEDLATADEHEYYKSVRFLNLTKNIPEGEVNERVDFIWGIYGRRDGP